MAIKWVLVCDNCPVSVDGDGDDWSFETPEGWIEYMALYFHDEQCFREWLQKNGKIKELEEFDNSVWMA